MRWRKDQTPSMELTAAVPSCVPDALCSACIESTGVDSDACGELALRVAGVLPFDTKLTVTRSAFGPRDGNAILTRQGFDKLGFHEGVHALRKVRLFALRIEFHHGCEENMCPTVYHSLIVMSHFGEFETAAYYGRSLLPISRTPSVKNKTARAGESTLKGCERS